MSNASWIDQPAAPRAGETLDRNKLETYLKANISGLNGSLEIAQFPNGYSNLTYLLRMGQREMVLRRPPFGAAIKTAHDMSREFRILSALYPAYRKVPQPLAYCEDESVIGAPFYVMERVRGVILRNRQPKGLTIEPELMQRLCGALVDTLVELHSLDYKAIGLGDFGKPEGYAERQITGWTKRYKDAQTDDIAELEQIAVWLAANRPPDAAPTLIHNDFRYDNMILDPDDLTRPLAILDWEMATIGDPLMDLGTTLAYWAEPDDPVALQEFGLTSKPGNLNRQQLVDRYAERSGRDTSNVLFYYVYGVFKLAVIAQQIYARYRKGTTQDERFGLLIFVIHSCAQMGAKALEKRRIHAI